MDFTYNEDERRKIMRKIRDMEVDLKSARNAVLKTTPISNPIEREDAFFELHHLGMDLELEGMELTAMIDREEVEFVG